MQGFGPVFPPNNNLHNCWAGIEYDPTNGTVSIGTLLIRGPGGFWGMGQNNKKSRRTSR